jgi:hypothetical protein
VYNITGQKANPSIPIPLPDMRDQPAGTHLPPPPASPEKDSENAAAAVPKQEKDEAGVDEDSAANGAQTAVKTETDNKEWKELNKHSIGHILESGDTAGGDAAEAPAGLSESPVKKIKPEGSAGKAAASPTKAEEGTAVNTSQLPMQGGVGAQFQPLGPPAFQPPPPAYTGHPAPVNYSNFAPNNSHHSQQQQQQPANLYYPPPPPQPSYHPPYTSGYEVGGGPASYPSFQAGPSGGGGGGHPYPPYPSAPVPKTNWAGLSCPYSIAQCPLYCCHVRAMQELEEGATDWARPYGPPASGFGDPCLCCINT